MKNEPKEIIDDENNLNHNYFKKAFFSRLKLNILIIILSIAAFIIEFFYREPLFNYSLYFEKNWQSKATEATISTFKILTKYGGEYLMAVPVLIVFCFFTLIKSYVYITFFIFCLQFHSIMKVWYGNKRPFWERQSLYKGLCDGGFGNPSGHSISTVFLYLTLFMYIKETKRLNKKYLILLVILLLCFFWILMILLSRIILGMHSINQVIYGSTLGVIISLFVFIVFKIHRMPVSVYKKFFREKKYIYISLIVYFVFIVMTYLTYFLSNKGFDYVKYNDILDNLCEKKVPKYRRFNEEGLFGSSTILAMLGMYLGQILFWYLIENKYKVNEDHPDNVEIKNGNDNNNMESDDSVDDLINHWNINRVFLCHNFKTVLKIILVFIISILPGILFIAIPNNSNLILIFSVKIGIPYFLIPFLLYGFGFYYLIKLSCGPQGILLKRLEQN